MSVSDEQKQLLDNKTKERDAERAMYEYQRRASTAEEKTQRLKAIRLAKEAADAVAPPGKAR